MGTDDGKKGNFYWSVDGETWNLLGQSTFSVDISLSDEDAARLWALLDPLEIVPNEGDKQ